MGKIVALGGGSFENGEMQNVAEHIVELTEKTKPSLLFLPTASFDNVAEDDAVIASFSALGCKTDILFLTHADVTADIIEQKIMSSDIIYADGGNLKFLMDTFTSTGADKVLLRAYNSGKVLCGHSSGAMCWFKEGYDDCGEDRAFIFVKCLGLIPFINCPHYQSLNWQTFGEAIKTKKISGIACDNGAGFCIDNGKYYTVCGNEDGNCYYYDAANGFCKTDLTLHPELLNSLK